MDDSLSGCQADRSRSPVKFCRFKPFVLQSSVDVQSVIQQDQGYIPALPRDPRVEDITKRFLACLL